MNQDGDELRNSSARTQAFELGLAERRHPLRRDLRELALKDLELLGHLAAEDLLLLGSTLVHAWPGIGRAFLLDQIVMLDRFVGLPFHQSPRFSQTNQRANDDERDTEKPRARSSRMLDEIGRNR